VYYSTIVVSTFGNPPPQKNKLNVVTSYHNTPLGALGSSEGPAKPVCRPLSPTHPHKHTHTQTQSNGHMTSPPYMTALFVTGHISPSAPSPSPHVSTCPAHVPPPPAPPSPRHPRARIQPPPPPRGLHSFPFQLNLSSSVHRSTHLNS
jgi:hypothetical protein